jgi:hypothetical protein
MVWLPYVLKHKSKEQWEGIKDTMYEIAMILNTKEEWR